MFCVYRKRAILVQFLCLIALAAQGWRALVVWECELKDRDALEKNLRDFIA